MRCPSIVWKLVDGALYRGNPIYRDPMRGDLAWEYCENLLALPTEVEAAVRAGQRGEFSCPA